jgi:RNA polymerase sigma-70 factor, ECF subfamily
LHAAIATLSDIEKAIIMLHLEEKDYAEIAEITGISKTNAGVKIMRIKEKLKQLLNNEGYGK